jgi:hypothetical protein
VCISPNYIDTLEHAAPVVGREAVLDRLSQSLSSN